MEGGVSTLVTVSLIILWIVVILLAVTVVALARQVGVLHERVAPAGALMPTSGPKVGETTEPLQVDLLRGGSMSIGGKIDREGKAACSRLLLFVSPTCPVCKMLVPTARSMAKHEGLELIFASDGDQVAQHEAYVRDLRMQDHPYVLSQSLGLRYGVSKLPFAVLLGTDGTLLGKGLVNTREHLESLVESARLGITTVQDYVREFVPEPVKESR
jgi:methylamine dehydrogenase accessory protein MauD